MPKTDYQPRRPYYRPSKLFPLYDFIKAYRDEHEYSPSIAEISEAFLTPEGAPTSTSVIVYYLDRMQELGWLKRDRNVIRSIVITAPATLRKHKSNRSHPHAHQD